MIRRRRFVALFATMTTLAGATGCGVSNLAFFTDTRLHFVSPHQRALVQLPVRISWTMKDFGVVRPGTRPVSGRAGYFAVFVDRAPIRPEQPLDAVADPTCRRTPGCVNPGYLANQGVFLTDSDSVTLTEIGRVNTYQTVQTHEATVVLLDSAGRRIGESAWYLDFRMRVP